MQIDLRPIGTVISKTEDSSEIEIHARFSPGLNGIDKYNIRHVWVLFWMHRLSEDAREILEAHPMGNRAKEKRGVFALRSPMRPNPIGLTRAELVERRDNILVVSGLDALEGSPILDIKPAVSDRHSN
jgi:tRNA-Thr(GGU) m(6)t(6)A37 methyltransferase TsaA